MKMSIKLVLTIAVIVCAIQHVIGYPGTVIDNSLLDTISVIPANILSMTWSIYSATANITTTAMNAVSNLWTSGDVIASEIWDIANPLYSGTISVVSSGATTITNAYSTIESFIPASSQPILRGVVGDLQRSIKQLEDISLVLPANVAALGSGLAANVVPCMNTFVQSVESATFTGVSTIVSAGSAVMDAANSILFSGTVSSIQVNGLITTGNAVTTTITGLADVLSTGPESLIICLDK